MAVPTVELRANMSENNGFRAELETMGDRRGIGDVNGTCADYGFVIEGC